jgi:hypothetical protein
MAADEQIELPLEGDDYGDELDRSMDEYIDSMYSEQQAGKASRKRKGSR